MKANELIQALQGTEGPIDIADQEIYLEAEANGIRTEQKLCDVLISEEKIILRTKEAIDRDPLNDLPIVATH